MKLNIRYSGNNSSKRFVLCNSSAIEKIAPLLSSIISVDQPATWHNETFGPQCCYRYNTEFGYFTISGKISEVLPIVNWIHCSIHLMYA